MTIRKDSPTASQVHIPAASSDITGGTPKKRRAKSFTEIAEANMRKYAQPGVPHPHAGGRVTAGQSRDKPKKPGGNQGRRIETRLFGQPGARNPNPFGKSAEAKVVKVDESLGLVFGWAIVCKENGQDYYDVQQDHIPEDAMLKAASDFMANSRMASEMHTGENRGSYLFCWPITQDIAKAMGLSTQRTGLMVGFKPPPDMLKRFASGALSGFSIGGQRIRDEELS